ncbi:MAG: hypothetical protein ABL959_07420 [Pyrinomonadaceae bacterium]
MVETNEHEIIRVRYIGQTGHPETRLEAHIETPRGLERVAWIGDLYRKETLPQMAIFAVVDEKRANLLEEAAIYSFSEWEMLATDAMDDFSSLDRALLNDKHHRAHFKQVHEI